MAFIITGLDPAEFKPFFGLSDSALASRRIIAITADSKPGYPCRVTLEDAEPGERVLLFNYESHKAATPYRSAYAIYARDSAERSAAYRNELPSIFQNRP